MIYTFRNNCSHCFSEVFIPILSDFSYGQLIFQTIDGKDFCLAGLIDNPMYDFITEYLQQNFELRGKFAEAQEILMLVADKYKGRDFTIDYPICPNCQGKLDHLNPANR